jgi:uncharacterized membrane protein YkvA (DUF1232 family)
VALWVWVAIAACGAIVLALLLLSGYLLSSGRREEARALVGLVPDLVVLCARLLRDPRVSLWRKLLLLALIAYLVNPLDLIPGSPVDDAVVAVLVLGVVLRGNGNLIREHWPGPSASRDILTRLAGRAKSPSSSA